MTLEAFDMRLGRARRAAKQEKIKRIHAELRKGPMPTHPLRVSELRRLVIAAMQGERHVSQS